MGLGELLVERGVVDPAALQAAATLGHERGLPLSKALIELGAATEPQIVAVIAGQLGMPFADTAPGAVDPHAAALLPRDVAAELTALPVAFDGAHGIVVALADPKNLAALERVGALTGLRAQPALAVRADLLRAIDHLAGSQPAPSAADAAGVDHGLLAYEQEEALDLGRVLAELVEFGGSDLHLTAGLPPTVRVDGELRPMSGYPELTPDELRKTIYGILTQRQRESFENALELDVSHNLPGQARFRVNVFQQRDSIGAVMRVIPHEIKPLDRLGVPPQLAHFATLPRGFVLVTGPTGSGKSTTLAALST
jgi:twitching motility protein PilT